MKVLVCDDLPADRLEFVHAIERAEQPDLRVQRLPSQELKKNLTNLIDSANKILSENGDPRELPETIFNEEFDLVILDNNLAHLGISGARHTAESIAGYIRAFSSTPFIISINKNPQVDFDLRYLIGDYSTRTDLAINLHHLSNPALWTHRQTDAKNGFLPWYWPKLLGIGENRRKKIRYISDDLDQSVCGAFGITPDLFQYLSRQARSLLSQAEETNAEGSALENNFGLNANFREVFLASGRSLPNKHERQTLLNYIAQGEERTRLVVARIVAAEIDFWFQRDVVGPQELLVDLPHLLMRMPFLLGERAGELANWNSAVLAATEGPPFALDKTLFETHLVDARFTHEVWETDQYFWWPRLGENRTLNAYFASSDVEWADAVFCEDCSLFLERQSEIKDRAPLEFVAQFEGAWNRRYVKGIRDIMYAPKTRFAQ